MFDRLTRAYQDWRVTVETTEQLNRLTDSQLQDIGLTREEIPTVVRGRHTA
ncbi:MAG: DUF1127 domain-containing protein [Pseudomonadota bacterium]